jgi:hypothetical protein
MPYICATEIFTIGSGQVASSSWWVPSEESLRIEDGRLLWLRADLHGKKVAPGDRMLEDFLTLSAEDATDEQILGYAKRWGPLQLCSHSLPVGHPKELAEGLCMVKTLDFSDSDSYRWDWDSLADWKRYAQDARNIVERASRIHRGEHADEDQVLGFPVEHSLLLALELGWLSMAPVTLGLEIGTHEPFEGGMQWRDQPPHLAHRTRGLFGALGAQLLAVAAGGTSIYFCSACGAAFSAGGPGQRRRSVTPKRPRAFCYRCGRKEAVRLAGMRRREKKRLSK